MSWINKSTCSVYPLGKVMADVLQNRAADVKSMETIITFNSPHFHDYENPLQVWREASLICTVATYEQTNR